MSYSWNHKGFLGDFFPISQIPHQEKKTQADNGPIYCDFCNKCKCSLVEMLFSLFDGNKNSFIEVCGFFLFIRKGIIHIVVFIHLHSTQIWPSFSRFLLSFYLCLPS